MRNLPEIRQDINAVDAAMRELYLLRMSLAREVALCKVESDDAIFKPDREAEIIGKRAQGMPDELCLKYKNQLQSTIRASREYQYSEVLRYRAEKFDLQPQPAFLPKTVCYQGAEGAYQHQAATVLFPDCEPRPMASWSEVFSAVRDGQADSGVVPVENTTAGVVSEVYDLLLAYGLYINRSHTAKIRHCLAALPTASLSDIKTVCSHPHALPQCSKFIAAHGFQIKTAANTALAAKQVAREQQIDTAAICSALAAKLNGLTVLSEDICDHDRNQTRFIAVSRTLTVTDEDNRIEIAFHLNNEAGALCSVLNIFADYGIDMTEIHSRPIKDSPWCYVFYLTFVGNLNDHAVRALLYQLFEELPKIRVVGSFYEQTEEERPCS